MKDELISLYIDNELNLDNKIEFVETVHQSRPFTDETIELLNQEKLLSAEMVTRMPMANDRAPRPIFPFWATFFRWSRPIAAFSIVLTLFAGILFWYDLIGDQSVVGPERISAVKTKIPYRFVIYRPGVRQTEIIGSFTQWQPVIMENHGSSGYWTITLNLPEGEHRYSYRIEGGEQMADPTVRSRETDDFGGENSIIEVKSTI